MPLEVLFIGNSHTYYNYMPRMIVELVKSENRGFDLYVDQSTGEGVSLEWHWNNFETRELIASRDWDFVVLQDRSGGPLEDPESFRTHARLLNVEIKGQRAQTIFYMTWADRYRPETQVILAQIYGQMARELGAKLAPVGLAWEKVNKLNPEIYLYHRDGRHANSTGTYLTACVFYSVLFNTSPEGLPGVLTMEGKKLVDLDEHQASFLQRIAHETVKKRVFI